MNNKKQTLVIISLLAGIATCTWAPSSIANQLPQDTSPTKKSAPCITQESDNKDGQKRFPIGADGKVQPCIRVSTIKKEIKTIPYEEISKYLASPRVVGAADMDGVGYVTAFSGEHIIAGTGDRLYARLQTESKQSQYIVYRPGAVFLDPETKESLGYEVVHIADAKIEAQGDPATLIITKASGEIRIGDKLMLNNSKDAIGFDFLPTSPDTSIAGNIISVLEGVSQVGQYSVVVLNKGEKDGIFVGHEFDIYQAKTVALSAKDGSPQGIALPDEMAGTLMVFRVFDRVSYALVLKATRPIHVLDKVKSHSGAPIIFETSK